LLYAFVLRFIHELLLSRRYNQSGIAQKNVLTISTDRKVCQLHI
jgi:hypothetical protein